VDKIKRSAAMKPTTTAKHLPCKSLQNEYVTTSRSMKESSFPYMGKRPFSSAHGVTLVSCQINAGGSFPESKVTGARSWHSPPFSNHI